MELNIAVIFHRAKIFSQLEDVADTSRLPIQHHLIFVLYPALLTRKEFVAYCASIPEFFEPLLDHIILLYSLCDIYQLVINPLHVALTFMGLRIARVI
jgi:hypothetical protein